MATESKILIAICIICSVLWVSTMDSAEEKRAAKHYANMVCEGHWPDYKNMKPECEESK